MTKRRKSVSQKAWCWYCDREFEDEKVLITHQKAKHFKCMYCNKKLNSASGLVIHVAQMHKQTMNQVPNAVEGHDTPELEIFGMEGVPLEDLERHYNKEPIVPYKRIKKASVPDGPALPELTLFNSGMMSPPLPLASPMVSPTTSIPSASNGPVLTAAPVAAAIHPPVPYTMLPYPVPAVMYPPPPAAQSPYAHYPPPMIPQGAPPNFNPYPTLIPSPSPNPSQNQNLAAGQSSSPSSMPGLSPISNPNSNSNPNQYFPPPPLSYAQPQLHSPSHSFPHSFSSNYSAPSTASTGSADNPAAPSVVTIRSFDNIMVPPSFDPSTGKVVPGSIIVAPDLELSLEERRAEIEKYRYHCSSTRE